MGFAGNGINTAHLYRSIHGGADWTNISSNLPNAPANSVVVDPNDANTVYVALDTGVYVTTQIATCGTANCWSIYGTSLPNAPVVELAAAGSMPTGDGRTGELRAATYGRGIWQIPLLTASTAAQPSMSLIPVALTYGVQAVATASAPQTITVTNTGNAPLTVNTVATKGDFNETDNCAGTTIAVNLSDGDGKPQWFAYCVRECCRWTGNRGALRHWRRCGGDCSQSHSAQLSFYDDRRHKSGTEHYDFKYWCNSDCAPNAIGSRCGFQDHREHMRSEPRPQCRLYGCYRFHSYCFGEPQRDLLDYRRRWDADRVSEWNRDVARYGRSVAAGAYVCASADYDGERR